MPMMNSTPQSVGYFSRRMSRLATHPATMPMTMKMRMVHMTGSAPVLLGVDGPADSIASPVAASRSAAACRPDRHWRPGTSPVPAGARAAVRPDVRIQSPPTPAPAAALSVVGVPAEIADACGTIIHRLCKLFRSNSFAIPHSFPVCPVLTEQTVERASVIKHSEVFKPIFWI